MEPRAYPVKLIYGPQDGALVDDLRGVQMTTFPHGITAARVPCPRRADYWLLYRGETIFDGPTLLYFVDWMPSNLHPSKAK